MPSQDALPQRDSTAGATLSRSETGGGGAVVLPTIGRRNVAAGIAGYGWTSVLQLIATPVLLNLLGPESVGLVGLYVATQGIVQIFDLGLSPSVNREMARASVEGRAEDAHDLLRTIEPGYWLLGIVLGLLIALLAPVLTTHWAATSGLSPTAIRRDVALIGLLIAVQWPITLYEGGLTGLQQITRLHVVGVVMRTAGVAAGLAFLYFGPRELWVYLLSLAVAALLHAITLAVLLRAALPRAARRARWNPPTVYRTWRFAAGMTTLMLLGAVFTHSDKLVLTRLLPLGAFGYYSLASMVSTGLYVLIVPVFSAVFPVLSGRIATGDETGERDTYHLGAQSLAVLVVPAAAVIAFFAYDLVAAWTSSAETARQAAPVVRLLVIGTALNGLSNAPFLLQLAHGRTRLGIGIHLGLLLLFLPALVIATSRFGAIGAAAVWIGFNALDLLLSIPLTHRLMLRGEGWRWLFGDVLRPATVGIVVAALGWLLVSRVDISPYLAVAGALLTLIAAWLAAAFSASQVRRWLLA